MLASCNDQTTLKLVVTFSIRRGLASGAGDHTRFRFLNHPASLVSFGIETDRDTREELLLPAAGSCCGWTTTSCSSCSRSEEEANFLSLLIGSPAAGSLRTGAGGARGGFPDPPATTCPELSYITSFSFGGDVFLKGANREIEREIFFDF